MNGETTVQPGPVDGIGSSGHIRISTEELMKSGKETCGGSYPLVVAAIGGLFDSTLLPLEIAQRCFSAIRQAGYAVVPRSPTKEMLDAAWSDALAENAAGVWSSMIDASK